MRIDSKVLWFVYFTRSLRAPTRALQGTAYHLGDPAFILSLAAAARAHAPKTDIWISGVGLSDEKRLLQLTAIHLLRLLFSRLPPSSFMKDAFAMRRPGMRVRNSGPRRSRTSNTFELISDPVCIGSVRWLLRGRLMEYNATRVHATSTLQQWRERSAVTLSAGPPPPRPCIPPPLGLASSQ